MRYQLFSEKRLGSVCSAIYRTAELRLVVQTSQASSYDLHSKTQQSCVLDGCRFNLSELPQT
jgi:hypothetical protein